MVSRIVQWAMVGLLGVGAATLGGATLQPTLAQVDPGQPIVMGAAPGQTKEVRGYVRGTVALFKTVGDRDSSQKRCMGYGSLTPDHTLELSQKTSRLTLQVRSKAQDSTLVIMGPNNRLYCADDSPQGGKDAGLILTNLPAGLYKIWVGAFDPGTDFRYTLGIQE